LRALAYNASLHQIFKLGRLDYDGKFWDEKIAGEWNSYLGGTISIELRNAITESVVRQYCCSKADILDVGCAAGALCQNFEDIAGSYTGIDISSVAIDEALRRFPDNKFIVSDIENYDPE